MASGPPVLHCTRLHDDQSPGKNPPLRPLICRSYGETATHWKTLSHKISTVPTRSAKSVVDKTSSHVTEKWAWRRSTQSYTLPPCCFISVIHLYILDWLILNVTVLQRSLKDKWSDSGSSSECHDSQNVYVFGNGSRLKKGLDSHSSAGQEEKEKSKEIKAARQEEEEVFRKSLQRVVKERESQVVRTLSLHFSAQYFRAAAETFCAVWTCDWK